MANENMLEKIALGNQEIWEAGYREGLKEGIRRYAVWKDGEQLVGVMRKPLKQVLEDVEKEGFHGDR